MIPDKDKPIIIAADIGLSLRMVSECPKWLDLKQISRGAWRKAHSSSSIYISIASEPSIALQYCNRPCVLILLM